MFGAEARLRHEAELFGELVRHLQRRERGWVRKTRVTVAAATGQRRVTAGPLAASGP